MFGAPMSYGRLRTTERSECAASGAVVTSDGNRNTVAVRFVDFVAVE